MISANDRKYMERAIELASLARGNTSPNPLVGAVIVARNRIIGEGYHARAGEAHAEVAAINSVREKDLLKEACMYVNLEPCSHYGRTPPCALRIKEEGIARVVIACTDPSTKVNGRGIEIIRSTGADVETGLLEEEGRELNKRFFSYHEKKRPYIILKWAQSFDGYLDRVRTLDSKRAPNWITGQEEKILVHKWRSEEDAILIGDKTACNDDPGLDVRLWGGKSPRRFLLSERTELPADLKIFRGEPPTVIFTVAGSHTEGRSDYQVIPAREKALEQVMKYMYDKEMQSVLIEGGNSVLSQFIDAGLWDEARIFKGQVIFSAGLRAPLLKGDLVDSEEYKSSRLEYWRPYKKNLNFENEQEAGNTE